MLKCLNYFGRFFLFFLIVLKALCKSLKHSFALFFFLFLDFSLCLRFLTVFFFLIFYLFCIFWDESLLFWNFSFNLFNWCRRCWFLFHLNFFNNLCSCLLCKFFRRFIFLFNWFWFWLFNFYFWFWFLLYRFRKSLS